MTYVDQGLRRHSGRRRSTPLAAVSAAIALVLLTGCGGDDGDSDSEKGSVGIPVYFVDDAGKLSPVDQELSGGDRMRGQGRAMAALEALVALTPEEGSGLTSHWGGKCGVGAGVESLQKDGDLITIKMRGAAGVTCNRSGAEEAQQRQQLAWTVVTNLDAAPSTPVQMYGPNGALMFKDVVADESFLAK